MMYRQSIEGCLSQKIGEAGLSEERLHEWLSRFAPKFDELRERASTRTLAHFRVVGEEADLEEARAAYAKLSEGAETIIVLGTGGSSLGGQALAQLGGWSIPGDDGPSAVKGPRLRFYDNLDERSFMQGMRILNFPKTRFIVISKSGSTGETLAQTLTAFQLIEEAGHASLIPELFLGVTEPEKPGVPNGLRQLFEARKIPILPHDTEIGGRFSAFTAVGLLPALARGLDVAAFRRGGRDVVRMLAEASAPRQHPAAVGAALAIGLLKDKGVVNSVMMPYCDRLECFSAWYVQLWAESLGKGGEGMTPVAALGPVDQHSQLQLFMDGPRHHLMNILQITGEASGGNGVKIRDGLAAEARAPYLAGHTISDLVRAQQRATADALVAAKRPVRTIALERLDEYALGALMMHFMIETILAAALLKVDPFDQPAVELGKRLTRQYLSA